jgi:ABC transporter DrrB family efflux protein
MFRGIGAIIYKEFIHIVRDPFTLFLMLLIPSIQLTIFGYAINLEVKHIPTAVYNLDGRPESRQLVDAFVNSGYFTIVATPLSDDALVSSIVRGKAKIGLKIPPDYTDRLLLGQDVTVQALIDGSDSTVAMQGLNVANAIALRQSLSIVGRLIGRDKPPVELRPRVLFNPDMKTANFMVPGLVGLIMQMVTMFLTAFAIVREKEMGTLEQLMATPVARLGLMLGKLIPYACIGAIETTLVLLLMRFLFGVHIAGSLGLLAGFSLIFLFTALGLGLLVSTIAENQVQALQVAFIIILPSVLLSGFVFPQENMPKIIYWVSQFIPLTYFMRILRGIIIRGAGFYDLWPQAAILAVIGFTVLTVSALRFRKTLS